jgi:precorrin-2 dehydrogenase/sirohydrochlorin ferrochelatase
MPVDAPLYPVNLVVEGRRCLVIGGGRIAARKIEGLLACGAVVHVIAREVGDEVRALADRCASVEERAYERGDVAGYRLVTAATGDSAVNKVVFDDGEAAGVWVNSADDPASCSVTLPAIVRQGPVMLTVSTGGHSPALATWLKGRLAAEIGPEYAELAALLSEVRAGILAAGRSTEGLDWQSALDSDMLGLIRAGDLTQAKERLETCLSSS